MTDAADGSEERATICRVVPLDVHVLGLETVLAEPGFRGCRYLAADLAHADPDHPGHAGTRDYNERIHELLERELREYGHPQPGLAADDFILLINGMPPSEPPVRTLRPAAAARRLAEQLLDGAPSVPARLRWSQPLVTRQARDVTTTRRP